MSWGAVMMMMSHAAEVLQGELLGSDVLFRGVSKDTRTIEAGDLYVALKGDNFDGHNFVAKADAASAAGVLVSEQQNTELPQICVGDTRLALGKLAASWRAQFSSSIIGITGSNGKTTVKEMCCSILMKASGAEHVLATKGNLNNDIGMPMTLLSLRKHHRYAVIEMGANHIGEIDYLTNIACPDVAVITNAGPAHLEGFGSVENVARAKAEIYGGLVDQGTAVINLDDEYAAYWCDVCKEKTVMTFSMQDKSADVFVEASGGSVYVLHTPVGKSEMKLTMPGNHNVMNALAAATASLAVGVGLEDIVAGLSSFSGVPGRLSISHLSNGACLIDDTYNANPLSLNAAIDVLVEMDGEPWLVLGDMSELGEDAASLHFDMGSKAKLSGIRRLFAIGNYSRKAVEAFGEGAEFFDDRGKLIETVLNEMSRSSVILVKGSRVMQLEQVVCALFESKQQKERETI
jgi:UDP-N-acetylmuramoyl-tripeptide--D-alanyl-D-alanine ligase